MCKHLGLKCIYGALGSLSKAFQVGPKAPGAMMPSHNDCPDAATTPHVPCLKVAGQRASFTAA
jgi:hypothetical protein